MEKSISLKRVVTLAGAMCAFWIGAGVATGQEILQFFTNSGLKGIIAACIFMTITGVATYFLCGVGQKKKFENPYDVFEYYCGKWIGKFYIWFSIVSVYSSLVVILAGGGATINQYYGIPPYIGTVILALLALGTALLGIEKLIQVLGVIGPFKVLLVLILGAFGIGAIVGSPNILSEGIRRIPTAGFETASSNWAWSGVLYALLCIINIVPFLVSLGATTKSMKEARTGGVVGTVTYTIVIIMLVIAELAYYQSFIGKQVPALAIASHISPVFGMVYTLMIVVAVYSAVVSMLVMVTRKFAVDKTKKFNLIATVLTAVAIMFGGVIPFAKLVNIIYPIMGYLTIAFIILMISKELRMKTKKKDSNVEKERDNKSAIS
ncbi:YkvI family membrane protein [Ectobacillus funiculus]|uniref:Membrane protein YkvI n=1 Tax=Ectobacillus funiculus TaxID=137993 RepID=A0ABV5WKD9_9BACI